MERKLAHVEKIIDIQLIPNADAIEVASILGWKVVIRKNEFKIGDLCVFCEVDSILPSAPWSEFLRDKKNPDKQIRLKTVRLRKQLSQGICFPLSILNNWNINDTDLQEGTDVTESLGVVKYEPYIPAQLAGKVKGNFPTHLCHKTDQIRIQSEPKLIDEIKGKQCYISQKIDGTSSTFIHHNGDIHVCSRNLSLLEDENNMYWKIFHKYSLGDVLSRNGNIAIQAECAGQGIQKNPLGLSDVQLFVFDVYDVDKQQYFGYHEMIDFCAKNNLQTVPILKEVEFNYTLDELLELAKGKYTSGKDQEGIVIRPIQPIYSETVGGRLSFKVLNNDALLKEE